MKIAAAEALAQLAREDVPDEVARVYGQGRLQYGPEYLIPTPFDPRLIATVSSAVAQAAMDSGVAAKPIADMEAYRHQLTARLNPMSAIGQTIAAAAKSKPKRIVFAEGEEPQVIRAAAEFMRNGYGEAVLIGYEDRVKAQIAELGVTDCDGLEIHNARVSDRTGAYLDFLYDRLQRRGMLKRDCQRLVNQDRNVFGACMVETGDADGMVTGLTRSYGVCLDDVLKVIDPRPGHRLFACAIVKAQGRTVFISDVAVHELPTPDQLADIASQTAAFAKRLGFVPRVAFLSFSNFGNPARAKAERIRDAVAALDDQRPDFEYDGEMAVDTALDFELMRNAYPFTRLTGPANVLIMPALHSANITYKLVREIGGGVLGPILVGLEKPVQILPMGAAASDIVAAATQTAYQAAES
ncbi:MAG: phosphate acyltransferase [Pseudomonadota bacterium]